MLPTSVDVLVSKAGKLPLVLSSELSERKYNRLAEAVAPNGEETGHFVRWLALSGNATGENSQPDRSNLTTYRQRSDPIESKSLQA